MKRLLLPLLIVLALPLLLGMSKKPPIVITFHTLAAPNDPPKTMFPFDLNGKRLLFKIVPEFSQENIAAYQTFPAENGNGKGMALQLDFRGKASLELITRQRKDEYLLAMINAKPVDFVVMDEVVQDGMITIWQGVPDEVIKEMAKKHPLIKKSGPPTMSKDTDMLPTTRKEKQKFLEAQQKEEKAEAERNKKGLKGPETPSLNLPTGPTSPKIPVEGGAPSSSPIPVPPQGPPGELPLPSPTKP